jgi:hypothetical protein
VIRLEESGWPRQTLVDELGVEPSARLQHLQRAILNSDPALDEAMFPRQSELVGS